MAADPAVRWDPWEAARAVPGLHVRLHPIARLLGGAFLAQHGDRSAVVLDPDLDGPARRVALAHELVHLERGGGCDRHDAPEGWAPVVSRDEAAVADEVARRLVPLADLASLAARAELDGGPTTTVAEVAAQFEVDEATARRALDLLRAR